MSKVPLRVLLVESSARDAARLLRELRRGGYDPVSEQVQTAETMLTALRAQDWDIVVADHVLPEFSGPTALELLRQHGYDLPFVILSGPVGEDVAVAALEAGAHDGPTKGRYRRLVPSVRGALREFAARLEGRRAEEQLRQRDLLFRQLAENIAEAFWITDPAKREILYVSPGYEKIWGRSCDSVHVQPFSWMDAVHVDDRARVTASIRKQASGDYDEEYRIVRPDGSVRWIRDRAFPIEDEHGEVYRITGIADDITERKLAEQALRHAKEFSENLIQTANVIILSLDPEGDIQIFNEAAVKITGYSAAELRGKNWFDILAPRDRYPQVWQEYLRLTAGGVPKLFENPILTKSGEERYVMWQNNHVKVDGRIVGTISFGNDITEQRRALDALEESEERLRMAIHGAHMYIWDWDIRTDRVVRSGPYERVYGEESMADSDYASFLTIIHPGDRDAFARAVEASVAAASAFHTEFRVVRPDGEIQWLETQGQVYCDYSGRATRMSGVTQDITQRKRAEQTIEQMAYYDMLTGLPNRNQLFARVLGLLGDEARRDAPMALLLMDLNHFKVINDTLGHHRGDMVLKEVGARLRDGRLFEDGMVARLGGDEFALLLTHRSALGDVAEVVRRIRDLLQPPVIVEGLPIAVEPAIGIAFSPEHGDTPDSLLQHADVAMYNAKKTGSSFTIYDPELDQHDTDYLALMGELRHAIESDQLVLFYQPKVDLKEHRVCGAEALIRWRHPQRGMVPPDQFIGLAEQTGLIQALTQWVLSTGIRQCGEWRRDGLETPLSINLSARNLYDPLLPDLLRQLLREHAVAPECLTMEITESAIMADPSRAEEILLKIRATGVRISIDDFGIGYSSLSYLRQLPVDCLKIDKSFVIRMVENEGDAMIVCSMIGLAHNLGLEVVAEGVESRQAYEQLVDWGCDTAQGYYMGEPLSAAEFAVWLRDSSWGRKVPTGRTVPDSAA